MKENNASEEEAVEEKDMEAEAEVQNSRVPYFFYSQMEDDLEKIYSLSG